MDREVCSLILQRWEVIASLREGAKDKRTLVEELDCSRSTVNRAVRELESMAVVDYVDGSYVVTSLGQAIADGFEELMATVDLRLELAPFLQWMPEKELDLDLRYLADADLLVSKPGEPHGVLNRHIERLRTIDEGYFILPFAGLHATETVHERIIHHDAECELVVAPRVLDRFQNEPQFNELIEEMVATGRLGIFRATTELPLATGIADDYVHIIAADCDDPQVLLETDREEVYQWAKDKFETHKAQADPVMTKAVI